MYIVETTYYISHTIHTSYCTILTIHTSPFITDIQSPTYTIYTHTPPIHTPYTLHTLHTLHLYLSIDQIFGFISRFLSKISSTQLHNHLVCFMQGSRCIYIVLVIVLVIVINIVCVLRCVFVFVIVVNLSYK